MRLAVLALDMLVLSSASSCRNAQRVEPAALELPSASRLTPRRSSPFEPRVGVLWQRHPRLPDTGEWRCAERGSVIWCAGGTPAAGVVKGSTDAAFRCGSRWGSIDHERVCIDNQPEYAGRYRDCRFEQERGIARVCAPSTDTPSPLPSSAIPACWLDRDCPSGRCERGTCACASSAACRRGSCAQGLCVEAP